MSDKNGDSAANLGFEAVLWKAADALRSNMDAADAEIRTRQHEAALDRLGIIADLAPDKLSKVREKVRGPSGLTDRKLKELVEAGELEDGEAWELGLATSLYRLCDEQAELAQALKGYHFPHLNGRPVKHLTDLIPLEEQEWVKVVKAAHVPLPDNTSAQAYARTLRKRIARLYPSHTLLAWVMPRKEVIADLKTDLEALQTQYKGDLYFGGRDADLPELADQDDEEKNALREGYDRLLRFANTHPGLRVHELLNDQQLSADDKIEAIEGRLGLLKRAQELNPTTEFLALDYTVDSQDVSDLKFDGLDDEERRMVLANWKAYQRGYWLTRDVDHTRTLMACGYHGAAGSIVDDGYARFKATTGFEDAVAEKIYRNAERNAYDKVDPLAKAAQELAELKKDLAGVEMRHKRLIETDEPDEPAA